MRLCIVQGFAPVGEAFESLCRWRLKVCVVGSAVCPSLQIDTLTTAKGQTIDKLDLSGGVVLRQGASLVAGSDEEDCKGDQQISINPGETLKVRSCKGCIAFV